jgi:hypothetical protein
LFTLAVTKAHLRQGMPISLMGGGQDNEKKDFTHRSAISPMVQ